MVWVHQGKSSRLFLSLRVPQGCVCSKICSTSTPPWPSREGRECFKLSSSVLQSAGILRAHGTFSGLQGGQWARGSGNLGRNWGHHTISLSAASLAYLPPRAWDRQSPGDALEPVPWCLSCSLISLPRQGQFMSPEHEDPALPTQGGSTKRSLRMGFSFSKASNTNTFCQLHHHPGP